MFAEISPRSGVTYLAQATVFALGGSLLVRYVNGAWPWADSPRKKRFYFGVPVLLAASWIVLALTD